MKLIEYKTEWPTTSPTQFLWLENDKVLCSYTIYTENDDVLLNGLWVDPDHRRQGLMKMMMDHLFSLDLQKDIELCVYEKDIFVKKVYRKYGFKKYARSMDKDKIFEWMLKKVKKWKKQ